MAQSNFEERIDTYEIESTNVMTGDRDRMNSKEKHDVML